MTIHHLKTWPAEFAAVENGGKPFDFRWNDRGFAVGDTLALQEWDPEPGEYTGREIFREVTYILADRFGLPSGYAILGLKSPSPISQLRVAWLPIDRADKTITNVEDFSEVGVIIRTSDRYWVRDEDGRVYEAAWSEGNNGDRDYWWDFEGESPVDPVEFMPHPLDPRFHPDAKLEDQP